jgi:transcriptional regulator with XRE-family HTH domain
MFSPRFENRYRAVQIGTERYRTLNFFERISTMEVKQTQFIELRAAGQSYNKIAKRLGVSKSTLIDWSREFCNEITNAKAFAIESIREDYMLAREHRMRILGTQLSKLTKEMLKRELDEMPTWRIYDMQRKVISEIAKDDEEIEFVREIDRNIADALVALTKKTVKWNG